MKKLLVMVAAISLVLAGSAFAAGGNVGCGLGSLIFKDAQNQSTLVQVIAVTTNGTSSGTRPSASPPGPPSAPSRGRSCGTIG